MTSKRVAGVGCGYRPEIAVDLLRHRASIDFFEVLAETCMAQPATYRAVRGLRGLAPLVVHGVKLSLGSADPGALDERAARLGTLARDLGAAVVSEHVALTRAGGREVGHLTAVAQTRAQVDLVARNVARARRHLPDVPFLLENIAWTLRWPASRDTLRDGDFYAEVVRATGCDLLLDVANLYANARNAGLDPLEELERFPLERVGMLHVAGGMLDASGFYLDTHAHPTPEAVFALVARVLERCGPVPVVLERDALFPPFEELANELARLRALVDASRAAARIEGPARQALAAALEHPGASIEPGALVEAQETLAALLLDGGASTHFAQAELARTRAVLAHKRLDDAGPLLMHLQGFRPSIDDVALRALASAPRADERQGVLDAFSIAQALAQSRDPRLAEAATRDLLLLRARFRARPAQGILAPRAGPFVGTARLSGRRVWALKPFGVHAAIRLLR